VRWYRVRASLLAAVLCAVPLAAATLWLGLVGAATVSALIIALAWIIYFHSERTVLTALRARQVSEVERPELHRLVSELARAARLPVPRLFVSPAAQPNILTVGYGPRSAAVCLTDGLLQVLSPAELRAVVAHELAHVARRDVAVSSWSAGLASLVAFGPLAALLLAIAAPAGREYGADIEGALLTGDPLALASALRTIASGAALPLAARGPLTAASHLMIACPFPSGGLGRAPRTHPPTGERVRRLEGLAGSLASGGLVSLAAVGELEREVEVLGLEQAHHGLQVVSALGRHAQLLALDLGLDALGPLIPDDLGHLLRVVL
jgi:heat shock protein HtpX